DSLVQGSFVLLEMRVKRLCTVCRLFCSRIGGRDNRSIEARAGRVRFAAAVGRLDTASCGRREGLRRRGVRTRTEARSLLAAIRGPDPSASLRVKRPTLPPKIASP